MWGIVGTSSPVAIISPVASVDATRVELDPVQVTPAVLQQISHQLQQCAGIELWYYIAQLSHELGFDPTLIWKIIQVESSWRTRIISHAGAVGLMQVKPIAAEAVLSYRPTVAELQNPYLNVFVGLHYLHKMLIQAHGDLHLALMYYNMGMSATRQLIRRKPQYDYTQYFYVRRIEQTEVFF